MGRGKNKQKHQQPQNIHIEELEIESKVEIDYGKLAEAIVKATQLSKDAESRAAEKEYEEMIKKRMESLGEKDFSHIKCWLWRNVRTILNKGVVFLKVLFVPREIAKTISAVDSLFKLITTFFFGLTRIILYILAAYLLVQTLIQGSLLFLPYAFVIFVFAQLIRIAQIEVEYMEDRGYLMAISSTIIAIASLVIAILSEFEVI
jgi:ABC-type multidrug transport system fused ATPase/permease subunit